MIKFLFKTGVYLFYWKKFKSQIISIIASIIIIWLIFGIYEDLIRIFEIKDLKALEDFLQSQTETRSFFVRLLTTIS